MRVLLVLVLLCAAPAMPVLRPAPVSTADTIALDPVVSTARVTPAAPATPAAPPAAPAPPAARAPSTERTAYPPVEAMAPTIRIEAASSRAFDRVRRTEGVTHAALVHIAGVRAGSGPDEPTLVVASVDPEEYRPLSPQVTADATDVWRRLDEGAVAVTHEHAQRLHLELGGTVRLGGAHGHDVRLGAIASNGVPPLADAIVGRETGTRLGIDQVPPTILVVTAPGTPPAEVADRLSEEVAGEVTLVPDPRAPHPVTPEPPVGSTVWDVLAMCESSGDWQANTGNGFYGGLQFLPESWWLVGGEGLPHEASREEQIHRAELLLARQGWKAWPVCSIRVGLREDPNGVG